MDMDTDNVRKPDIPKINLIEIKEAASPVIPPQYSTIVSYASPGNLDNHTSTSYKRNSSFEPLIRFETMDYTDNFSSYSLSARNHDQDYREIIDLSILRTRRSLGKCDHEYQLSEIAKIKKFTFKPSNS